MPPESRKTATDRKLYLAEGVIAAVLGVLFLIVALGDEFIPGLVGGALSLLLIALIAFRAARSGE